MVKKAAKSLKPEAFRGQESRVLRKALDEALLICGRARSVNMELFFEILAVRDRRSDAKPELLALLKTISNIAALERFDIASQKTLGHSKRVDFLFLLGWLLNRGQDVGPAQAIADLERFLLTDKITVTETLAVTGLRVYHPIELGPFRIVPWDDVAGSHTGWAISAKGLNGRRIPDCALLRKHEIETRHWRPWDSDDTYFTYSIEPVRHVLRALTAHVGAGIEMLDYWIEPPEWAAWSVHHSSFGLNMSTMSFSKDFVAEQAQQVERTIAILLEMDDAHAARISIPYDRLNASFLEGVRVVDASIELGIALESLFAPQKSAGGIGVGIRTRAARFMGGTPADRTTTLNLVKDIYALRSIAVHSGRFGGANCPKKWRDEVSVINTLQEGQRFVGKALIEITHRGEPNWEAFDISG